MLEEVEDITAGEIPISDGPSAATILTDGRAAPELASVANEVQKFIKRK